MKKTGASLLILVLVWGLLLSAFQQSSLMALAASPRTLTLNQALSAAVQNSYELLKVSNDTNLKKIELTQAIQAIRDIRKNQSTIRFSLLFNIKFPVTNALPREMELIMKVPQLQSDLKDLQRKQVDTRLRVRMTAETAYCNVLELMKTCSDLEKRLAGDRSTLNRLTREYLSGTAAKSDVEEMKKSVEQLEKSVQSNLIRYENAKKKLSDLTGINVKTGYTFSEELSTLSLTRSQLSSVVAHALANDYALYQKELNRKIAETEVATLRNLYNNRWGSLVSVIESEIARNGPIDFTTFLDKYEQTLTNIENPYVGYYRFRILFITISIPKEWFRSELSGIRYFEDQKYALYIALMEKEDAVREEAQARKDLTASIEDNFNTLLELWTAYQDSLKEIQRTQAQYELVRQANLRGEAQFLDLESARNDILSWESAAYAALIAYNKSLAAFDYTTAGAITQLKTGVGLATDQQYDSGVSWLSEEESQQPTWYLNTLIDEYKFLFGLSIPEESGLEVTHYELCTEDGQQIGSRTPVDQVITHLPLVYQGSTQLQVRLYQDKALRYTAQLDGAEFGGVLELKPVPEGVQITQAPSLQPGTLLGTWQLEPGSEQMTAILSFQLEDQYPFAAYRLLHGEDVALLAEQRPLSESFQHLSFVLAAYDSLTLELYDQAGDLLCQALLLEDMGVKTIKVK